LPHVQVCNHPPRAASALSAGGPRRCAAGANNVFLGDWFAAPGQASYANLLFQYPAGPAASPVGWGAGGIPATVDSDCGASAIYTNWAFDCDDTLGLAPAACAAWMTP